MSFYDDNWRDVEEWDDEDYPYNDDYDREDQFWDMYDEFDEYDPIDIDSDPVNYYDMTTAQKIRYWWSCKKSELRWKWYFWRHRNDPQFPF